MGLEPLEELEALEELDLLVALEVQEAQDQLVEQEALEVIYNGCFRTYAYF